MQTDSVLNSSQSLSVISSGLPCLHCSPSHIFIQFVTISFFRSMPTVWPILNNKVNLRLKHDFTLIYCLKFDNHALLSFSMEKISAGFIWRFLLIGARLNCWMRIVFVSATDILSYVFHMLFHTPRVWKLLIAHGLHQLPASFTFLTWALTIFS